jgi:microcystin degradation protein MlrC
VVAVTKLARDCWQSFGPTRVPLGDTAAIRVGGIDVVLISNRTQALGLELFRNLGIEPTARKLVVRTVGRQADHDHGAARRAEVDRRHRRHGA